MALTFTAQQYPSRFALGANQKLTVTNVTWDDSSYATGGVAVTPANLGLSSVDAAVVSLHTQDGGDAATTVQTGIYLPDTGKIKLFLETGAEVAAGADIGSLVTQVVAWGAA